MTITRKLSTATAVALLTAAGVAAGAAPVVGSQKTLNATTAPLTIAGTGIKKGQRLPTGARIIYRDVTLGGTQTVRLTLRAPAGKTIRGLAPAGHVGFSVVDKGNYAGRKKVTVRAYNDQNLAADVSGQIYGLAR